MKKAYDIAKTVYLCLLTAYVVVREVPALHFLVGSNVVSGGVFLAGFALVLWGLLARAEAFLDRRTDLLILFTAVAAVSCLLNRRYGITDNVKALGTVFLFCFLLFPAAGADKTQRTRQLRAVFGTLTGVWSVFVLLSVFMYLFSVELKIVKVTGEYTSIGFASGLQRLWGLFQDPNYAGFVSVAAVLSCVYFFLSVKRVLPRIAAAAAGTLNFLFVVLGGSRAANVAIFAVALVGGLYASGSSAFLKKRVPSVPARVCAVALCCALTAGVVFGGYTVCTHGMPALKKAVETVSSDKVFAGADAFFDGLFSLSDIEIAQTSASRRGAAADTQSGTEEDEPVRPLHRTDVGYKSDISSGRFDRWASAIEIFKTAPVLGASPRNIIPYAKENVPATLIAQENTPSHNGYLDVLVSTGAVGAVLMLAFLLACAVPSLVVFFRFGGDREFIFTLTVFLNFAISGVFLSDLFFLLTPGAVCFWYALGHVCAAAGEPKKHGLLYKPFAALSGRLTKERNG